MVVEIGRRRSQKDETLEVSFDGDTAARLVVGDKFSIRKASDTTRILKLSNKSFLEILSKRCRYTHKRETEGRMKTKRQAKMLELIKRNDIETQEELSDYLEREGYQVTQATVSRDIRELKLTKVAMSNGRQKYVALQETDENLSQKYVRVFHDGFVSMDMAQNILVIKTVSGMAMAVAAALDAMHMHEIVGCIAGDDTIMCAIRSVDDTVAVMNRLKKLVED